MVRHRSPWLISTATSLIVFLLVAAASFGWKYRQLPPPLQTAPPRATARVYIHQANFACQPAWQEIQGQWKSEVRDHLEMVVEQSGEMTVVSISLSDLPPESIVPLDNVVASAYAQCCRSQWKMEVEQACFTTQEKVREARRAVETADARWESLRQRQDERTAAAGKKPEASAPALVENPQWTEAARRLAELEEKRRVLLFNRTPLHPSVQEIEMRIGEARREMSSIPEKIAQWSPGVQSSPTLPPVALEELESARQSSTAAHGQLQKAEDAARSALAARSGDLRIDVEPADALPPIVATRRCTPKLLVTVLLAAATSAIGLGMIALGAALEPTIAGIGELQGLLPVPVLGVVPAVNPSQPVRSNNRRRVVRCIAILAGLLLLIGVGWLFFRV